MPSQTTDDTKTRGPVLMHLIQGGLARAGLVFLCASVMHIATASEGQPVRTALVESKTITRIVSTYGVLAPKIEDLSFQIDGRINRFHTSEGKTVEAGELLADLETRDAEDRLDKSRVARDQAKRQLERFTTLSEQGMIQSSQLDDAKDQHATAQIAFEQAQLQLERCKLIAPARGVILKEYLDSRTTIRAGTPIYSFRDISRSWITEVELTDQNAFVFGIGTKARAKFAPYPAEIFSGELTKQAGVADENDGLYTVEITLDANGRELRPGMIVEIDLIHESTEMFTTLPLDAIVDLRSNRGTIYLLNESDNTVEEQEIHIVAITGASVAIAEPIAQGRKVVIRGQQSLRNNTPVRVI